MEEKVVGSIQKGFLVLIGVGQGDDEATADKYMKKLLGLRIFEDENGKTNKSLADVDGQLLMVSQFTLYANCKKGNRPSFTEAGEPHRAEEHHTAIFPKLVFSVKHGINADEATSESTATPSSLVMTSMPIFTGENAPNSWARMKLTALGLPAIYVPLPIGNGEQRFNAQPVVDAHGHRAWLWMRLLQHLQPRFWPYLR